MAPNTSHSGIETFERIAVLESKTTRLEHDISALHAALRSATEMAEKDRQQIVSLVQEIRNAQAQQKSFLGGVVFVVSSLWVVGTTAWSIIKRAAE